MLELSSKLTDKSFYIRLNTIPSAHGATANDVRYHLRCWSAVKRETKRSLSTQSTPEESIIQTTFDIEIINMIQFQLSDPSEKILDMNSINISYQNLLYENGMPENEIKQTYKRYLKLLIQETLPSVKFIKPDQVNKPEQLVSCI